jgi:predicted regulator of Ras-like GTPase activity (Roadblock/LC7/MglB family)
MEWFQRLSEHPLIEAVLLTDNRGRILRSSRPMPSDDELIASMIQAAEVLAQSLVVELDRGPVQMVQITTDREHLLLFPLAHSTYHLAVIVGREVSLLTVIDDLDQILPDIDLNELAALDQAAGPGLGDGDTDELNADELIEAVREWLQRKSSGKE